MHRALWFLAIAFVLFVGQRASAQPLPQGNTGIAARHPDDVGIGSDSEVIFADDFEGYASAAALETRWNAGVYHQVRIATEADNVYAGRKALEFTVPQQPDELTNTVAHTVSPELDVLFLRFYSRYDPSFDASGSSHNGGGISAHYYVNGMATPGVPADGTNKFLMEFECWRDEPTTANPGDLNVYIYHPEQRSQWGDHFFPDGTVAPFTSMPGDFGPDFVARPKIIPERGRWYSYEVMLRANTPGQRDGRIALWLDGALIADFQNLRLRDVASLKIDRFNLSLHIASNTVRENRKWYDNVVAARSYIGPMATSSDAGAPADAGASVDAGAPRDAGASVDAGPSPDAGTSPDGGVEPAAVGGCGCRAMEPHAFALLALLTAVGRVRWRRTNS